jgi:hypothetical protein
MISTLGEVLDLGSVSMSIAPLKLYARRGDAGCGWSEAAWAQRG